MRMAQLFAPPELCRTRSYSVGHSPWPEPSEKSPREIVDQLEGELEEEVQRPQKKPLQANMSVKALIPH